MKKIKRTNISKNNEVHTMYPLLELDVHNDTLVLDAQYQNDYSLDGIAFLNSTPHIATMGCCDRKFQQPLYRACSCMVWGSILPIRESISHVQEWYNSRNQTNAEEWKQGKLYIQDTSFKFDRVIVQFTENIR